MIKCMYPCILVEICISRQFSPFAKDTSTKASASSSLNKSLVESQQKRMDSIKVHTNPIKIYTNIFYLLYDCIVTILRAI